MHKNTSARGPDGAHLLCTLVVTLNLIQQWGLVWRDGYIMCGGLILPAGSTWESLVCTSYATRERTNTYMSTHSMKERNVV